MEIPPSPVTTRLRMLQDKLARLRAVWGQAGGGASPPDFGERLSEDRIIDIERMLGCRLPEGYRRFLIEVGNGGFGPGLGLIPFGADSMVDPRIPADDRAVLNPSAPFAYLEDWNFPPLKRAMEEQSAQLEELQTFYFSTARIDGTIRVADLGCGAIALLVLNGTQRGRIWLDFRGTFGGIAQDLEFLDWYDAWLDDQYCHATISINPRNP